MGFGANFTKVTLGKNHGANVLVVEGQSDDEVLRRVKEMHVALVLRPETMLPVNGGKAAAPAAAPRTASVDNVKKAEAWRVSVPQDAPLPKAGANVLVLGAAVLSAPKEGDEQVSPFYWSMIVPIGA